jgi:tetratricopeptide (TPR) repeat protein
VKVLVSGQAGLAVAFSTPPEVRRLDSTPIPLPDNLDPLRIFEGCSDVKEHTVQSLSEVDQITERAWACDRALRLFLLALDPTEPSDALREYAECVEELLEDEYVLNFVHQQMSSVPFPTLIEINRTEEALEGLQKTRALFDFILDLQGTIRKVHDAYNKVYSTYFDGEIVRSELLAKFVADGTIAGLAVALHAGEDISFTRLLLINQNIRFKEAIGRWMDLLQTGVRKLPSELHAQLKAVEAEQDDSADWDEHDYERAPTSSYHAYTKVREQQVRIVEFIKERDIDNARKWTQLLVQQQRSNSSDEQIAKTLSLLAQQAKKHEVPQLQLEWSKWATQENPADPKTFGHYADASITVGNLLDAQHALDSCEAVGGRLFAEGGRARILRELGKLAEARTKFLAAAAEFADSPDVEYAWMGAADTLRDMGRIEEALAEYQQITSNWPLNAACWNGLALTQMDLGRLDDAIQTFGKSSATEKNPVALTGRAAAYKQKGKFEEAIEHYETVITKYPNNHVALCGKAEVFRTRGEYQLALEAYQVAIERCPFTATPHNGRAAVLLEMGNYQAALDGYRDTAERFPLDQRAAAGVVKSLKKFGRYSEALQEADSFLTKFPFANSIKVLRAQLLHQQGESEAAILAFDNILLERPYDLGVITAKSAVLISLKRLDEANRLLPDVSPKTQFDWTRFLLRTMALQEQGKGPAAISKYRWGLNNCPFFQQRRMIRSALAALQLASNQKNAARNVVEESPQEVSNVIAFHVFAATHRTGHARKLFEDMVSRGESAEVLDLAREIGRREKLFDGPSLHSTAWLRQAEKNLILDEAA